MSSKNYRAADILVESLVDHGVSRLFCVPGESYLSVLDALKDEKSIDVVAARHEGGAGFMALADAKITGRPGICFVSRGPGAMNASIAVHSAQQDAMPLIVFIGQVARADLGRDAFQEIDYVTQWATMTKWVWQVTDANMLAETVSKAFQIAMTPTPGPVVIALPEDMLNDIPTTQQRAPVFSNPRIASSIAQCEAVKDLLVTAQRPLIIAGQALNTAEGRDALKALAEQLDIPVAASFRQQDILSNRHPTYAGHLVFNAPKSMVEKFCDADLILAIGTRLGDVTTQGYSFPRAPQPEQKLVHVYPDPNHVGKIFAADLPIIADPTEFCRQLTSLNTPASEARSNWRKKLSEFIQDLMVWHPKVAEDGVVFGQVVAELDTRLADNAIICIDAGNFSGWVQRHLSFHGNRRMVSTISGSMGSGVPAGVATSLRHPDRQVIVFVGDGGFMMTGAELATACQYGASIKIIVSDNNSYATIRLHQEIQYPGRISGTQLKNPDFEKLGQAYGVTSHVIQHSDDVKSVLERALAEPGSSLIVVKTSLQHISAYTSLAEIAAKQK